MEVLNYTTEAEWLEARKKDLTSTESAALFGLSPYVTQFELWHRKHSGEAPEFQSNERMQWGNHLEAAIAKGIAEEQDWTIEPLKSYWRDPDLRLGSSFDFVITNLADGPAHLEIKNVDYLAYRDGWIEHDDGTLEAPAHIELQVQHQMAVSGFKRSFIGALIGGNRAVVIERPRDEEVISAIKESVAEFWRTVDANEEPAPMMPVDAAAVIQLAQHTTPGSFLDASGDEKIEELVREYKRRCGERDAMDKLAEVTKAELLMAIGDAEKVLVTGYSVSAGMVAANPGTTITEAHIGQVFGARKGFRSLRVTAKKSSKE